MDKNNEEVSEYKIATPPLLLIETKEELILFAILDSYRTDKNKYQQSVFPYKVS